MISNFLIGVIGLFALIGLIAIRIPVVYSMMLVGTIGTMVISGPAIVLSQLKTLGYGQFSIYSLSVVPMFVLMGNIASRAGLSQDLFRASNAWLGWMKGGVAMSAIAACAGFGSVCGSSLATASTMGQVALPELRRYKYSPALATGTLAAGGVLGILIPPSIVLVIYAVIVEANIITMFTAALIPGLMAVIFFIITIAIYVRVVPGAGPRGEAVSRREKIDSTIAVIPVVIIFGLVIGGIYLGFFNPTPAAALGVFLVTVYGIFRGSVKVFDMKEALLQTAKTSGMIYLILLGAELLKIFMSRAGVPQSAAQMMADSSLDPTVILTLWLGYGIGSKIVMTIFIIYFPVTSAFHDGLNRVDPGMLDLSRLMGASQLREMWLVRIPAALPSLASGLRLAAVYAPIGAVLGEWVGASGGLGYLMLLANGRAKIDLMFAALFVLAAFTVLLHICVSHAANRLTDWSQGKSR